MFTVLSAGTIRRWVPIVGLSFAGPAATAYVLRHPSMLAATNCSAVCWVLIFVFVTVFMAVSARKITDPGEARPLMMFSVVLAVVTLVMFYVFRSQDLVASLTIMVVLSWLVRWNNVNAKVAARRRAVRARRPAPQPPTRTLSILEDRTDNELEPEPVA